MKHWKDLSTICFDKEKYQTLEDFWHDVGKQIELLTKYGYAVILENEMSADQPIVTIRTFDTEYDEELYFMSEDDLDLYYQGEQANKQPQAVEQAVDEQRIETMVACTNCGKSVIGDKAIVDEDGYPYCCEECCDQYALDHLFDEDDDDDDGVVIGTCAYCWANVMDNCYIYAQGKYFCCESCLKGYCDEDDD